MRTILRWAFRIVILLVVLIVAAILLFDTFARIYLTHYIRRMTGLETRIGRFDVSFLNSEVTIENLVIYNTAAFGGSPMIDMPELHLEYDRAALAANKLHLRLLRVNFAEINVVEDRNGRKNYDALAGKAGHARKALAAKTSGNKAASEMQFSGIDTLNLTFGKATYQRLGSTNRVEELKLNIDHQVFNNIRTKQDFDGAMMIAALRSGVNIMQNGQSGVNLLQLFSPARK